MRIKFIFVMLMMLSACVTTETPNKEMSEEERIKLEEQQAVQKDMKHNLCVSKGHIVGSPDYDLCMNNY